MHLIEVTDIIKKTRKLCKWKGKRHRKVWKGLMEDNSDKGAKQGKVGGHLESESKKIKVIWHIYIIR